MIDRFHESVDELLDSGVVLHTPRPAIMCSIKGPEIRTTLLKDHASLSLVQGQEVCVYA